MMNRPVLKYTVFVALLMAIIFVALDLSGSSSKRKQNSQGSYKAVPVAGNRDLTISQGRQYRGLLFTDPDKNDFLTVTSTIGLPDGFKVEANGPALFLSGSSDKLGSGEFEIGVQDSGRTEVFAEYNYVITAGLSLRSPILGDFVKGWSIIPIELAQESERDDTISFSVVQGALPIGLRLKSKDNIVFLEGTPVRNEDYDFTVLFTDSKGSSIKKRYVGKILDYYRCDPHFGKVGLLLPFDSDRPQGGHLRDESELHLPVNAGTAPSAKLDPTLKRSGNSSLYLPGKGYIEIRNSELIDLGKEDFTIELWLTTWSRRPRGIISRSEAFDSQMGQFALNLNDPVDGALSFYGRAVGQRMKSLIHTRGLSINQNEWTHLAVIRNKDTLSLFVNGLKEATETISEDFQFASSSLPTLLGAKGFPKTKSLVGNVDDLRITKGTARYYSDFRPLAHPFPTKRCVPKKFQRQNNQQTNQVAVKKELPAAEGLLDNSR